MAQETDVAEKTPFMRWLEGDDSVQAGEQGQAAPAQPAAGQGMGLFAKGNLPLDEDGKIGPSTIVQKDNGDYVLVPASDGQGGFLNQSELDSRYRETGENYGTFLTLEDARTWQGQHTSLGARQLIRSQLLQSRGISLEQQRRDREMAERLGLPATVISYQREWAEDETFVRDLEQHESLLRFAAQSPEHAAIAREDLAALGRLADFRGTNDPGAAANNALVEELARTHRIVGQEGEATMSDRLAMGELGRQEAALGQRYLQGQDITAELAELDRAKQPYMQKVMVQGPIEDFFGMGIESLPSQLQMYAKGAFTGATAGLGVAGVAAAQGAVTGGTAGTVLGPVGSTGGAVAGALANATASLPVAMQATAAGWVAGIGAESFRLESGNMAVTLLRERDADGKALPREIITAASTIYGTLSAAMEMGSEGLFLKLLKPLGLAEGTLQSGASDSAKGVVKNALVRAAQDKNLWGILADIGTRLGINGLQEGATEALQETAAIFTEVNARNMANMGSGTRFDANLPDNFWERIGDAFLGGMSGSLILSGGPILATGGMRAFQARRAETEAVSQREFHALVEQTKLKQDDPAMAAETLAQLSPEMAENVIVPLDEAVRLNQSGVDILTPLGIDLETAQADAAAGQVVEVRLADLHARLDQTQFDAVSNIMQRSPESAAAADVATVSEDTVRFFQQAVSQATEERAAMKHVSYLTQEQQSQFEAEAQALRSELREAVENIPNLRGQLRTTAMRGQYIDGVVELAKRAALLSARHTGKSPVDLLRTTVMKGMSRERALAAERGDIAAALNAELESFVLEGEQRRLARMAALQTAGGQDAGGVANVQTGSVPAQGGTVQTAGEVPAAPAATGAPGTGQVAAPAPAAAASGQQGTAGTPSRRLQSTLSAGSELNLLETPRGFFPVRYEIWELGDMIPSHDPYAQFRRREDYPKTVQERAYHSVAREQEKVVLNAANLNPRYLLTDNPDASTGPPVITTDGIVLGGNSRTMSMQLAFRKPELLKLYKDALLGRAQMFGFNAAEISGMQQPVLVRVLQTPMTVEEMEIASNAFNQTTTEELDPIAEGVSKSRRIDDTVLAELAAGMEEYDTLREFLASNSSKTLVDTLRAKEIIAPNQAARLVNENSGLLNELGKSMFENALRGMVVQDYDILSNASENMASVLRKLDRAILSIARLKQLGGKWDMSPIVTKALRQIGRAEASMKNFRLADLPGYFASGSIDPSLNPDKHLLSVQAMALMLANGKVSQKEVATRFALMARFAEQDSSATGMLSLVPVDTVSPEQAFQRSFMETVASLGSTPLKEWAPEKSSRHSALLWAYEHSDRHMIDDNLVTELEKQMQDQSLSDQERESLRERFRILAGEEHGQVSVYKAQLGDFFKADPQAKLWQGPSEQTSLGAQAHASLQRDIRNFAQEVDKIVAAGRAPEQAVHMLSQTPLVMQLLGTDTLTGRAASEGGIYAAPHVFDGKHPNMTPEMWKQIPAAMADPIAIFDSDNPQGRANGDLVFMLEVTDANGATVVVPVALQGRGDRPRSTINIVKSAYTKSRNFDGRPSNTWFVNQAKKNARYVNGQKIKRWQASSGVQFPFTPLLNAYGNTVYTEEDLVNLREQNRTLYQEGTQAGGVARVLNDAEELASGNTRGAVTASNGCYIVELFKNADVSTLLHEMGHIYFMEMERAVNNGAADAAMLRDFQTLRNWVGAVPSQNLTAEQHEHLARGLEAYYLEGKAPSEELQPFFLRLRKWLKRIYRSVTSLGVQLNDDVRRVFDRMLATEQEIEETAAANNIINLTTGELDILGVPKAQQQYTRMVLEAAKERAGEELLRRRDSERFRRIQEYTAQAKAEVAARPVYVAMEDMQKTPLDQTAVQALLGDNAVEDLRSRGITLAETGGEDPTAFAARHGFDSAEDMFAALRDAPRQGQAVRRRVMEMDAAYDSQYGANDALFAEDGLTEHTSLVARHLSRVAGRPYIQQRAIAQVVDGMSAGKTVIELSKAHIYMRNVREALKRERKAIAQKDFAAAVEANTQARLNLEMIRRAKSISDNIDKLGRQVNRFIRTKSHKEIAKFGLMSIASRHGFIRPNSALLEKYEVSDFESWAKELEADGFTMALDPDTVAGTLSWREMTPEQFEDFADTLNNIIHLAREQKKLLTSQKQKTLEEAAREIEESVKAHGKERKEDTVNDDPRLLAGLKRFHAAHMKVEELCLQMDGGKVGGPMWTYIYKPIADAENRQVLRLKKERDALRELFARHYSRKELASMQKDRLMISSIGQALTKEQRLAVALNMGNEGNMARLKTGHGWDDRQLAAIAGTLTSRDWQFVQDVWDYLESFKDESFKLEELITGVRPKAVQAKPFRVVSADGQTVELRGGYYPIRYNPRKNSEAFRLEEKAMAEELMGGRNFMHAMTKHGHNQERTKKGLDNAPLLLSMSVVPEHVYNVVHDLCYRPAVIDVGRVIRNKQVRNAVERYVGRETYQLLKPWLVDCANERSAPLSDLNAFSNWARAHTSIFTMGLKATTAFTQVAGIVQTVDVLGAQYTGRGVAHVLTRGLKGPRQAQQFLAETRAKSPFMAGRLESFDRDLRDTTKRLSQSTLGNWVGTMQEWAFKPMAYVQFWSVDLPTWWGAYEKGLKDYKGDEQRAVDYADSIVRQAQGSGSTKDLAAIQRGSDLQRLFTMFYSYFNVLYNLGARHIKELRADRTPAGIARAATQAMLLWFLPAALSEFLAGRWGGDDEDESTLAWLTKLWLAYPLQSIVGIRDIVSAVSSGYGYQLSPASAPPAAVAKAMQSIYRAIEKEDMSVMVKPTASAAFYVFGLPGAQIMTTTENVWDYLTDPKSEFYVRDLFFRKPAERRDD